MLGSPCVRGVRVHAAEVERRDRRRLASAAARRAALEARPDRAREHVDLRVLARGVEEGCEPSRAGADVVVDEHQQLARRALHARVAAAFRPSGAGCGS